MLLSDMSRGIPVIEFECFGDRIMQKISVLIPCYNEEDNVIPMTEAVEEQFQKYLSRYDYEIIFIDNDSKDTTREKLRWLCAKNKHVNAIFNAKNFGQFNSPYYGLQQTTGECAILLCCDFQDPPELIPTMVEKWEQGAEIVSCIKTSSEENKLIRFIRTAYYKTIKKFSDVEQIEHFTGFGLYDKKFIDLLRKLDDPIPFLRGIVAEYGAKRVEIRYEQKKRRAGKTSNNFYSLYDAAMLSFTSYTTIGLRLATFGGFLVGAISMVLAIIYLILKLMYWDRFSAGSIPVLLAVLILSSIQLFFIGFLGEYVLSINKRVMHRPLVVEEERINFDDDGDAAQ